MEATFLKEWDLRFGSKPPEWVFHFPSEESEHQQHMREDFDREIRMRQTNIEQLRFEIQREEFLLDWLCQRKAKLRDTDHPPATLEGPTECENSQEVHVNGDCSSPNETHVSSEDNFDKHPVEQESNQKTSLLASQSSLLEGDNRESSRSLIDTSDYYTAAGQTSSSFETLNTDVHKKANSITSDNITRLMFPRARISYKVINSDVQIARAVKRRLIEQGLHWSCQFIDLEGKNDDSDPPESLSPISIRRTVSDSSLSQRRLPSVTFQSDQYQVLSSCSPHTPFSVPVSSEQEASSSDTPNSLEPISQISEHCEQRDDQTETPSKDSNPLAMLVEDDTKGSTLNEAGSFPIVGKRSSNGIILDSLVTNKILAIEDSEECDPLLNLMASHAQKTRTPRSSIDHVRDRVRGVRLSNGDLDLGSPKGRYSMGDKENNLSDPSSEGEPSFLRKRSSTELSPVAPWYKFDRRSMNIEDDECTTPKGEISMSLTPDNISDVTNNASESSGALSNELLDDPERAITKERAFIVSQRPKVERNETLTLDNAADQNRNFSIESFDKDSDPTRTLTRARVLDFKQSTPNIKPTSTGFLRLDSLSEELHKALSQIRTTPEMSMATLLDLDENSEMNEKIQESYSEPSLDDLELFQSGEVDEATISAYTLRNEIFGSRSNSTTSIPSLFLGPESVSSTPDIPNSPSHPSVNLRPSSGGKRRERKRMGNAELESIATVGSDDGSDLSPAHVGRGSISPLADESSDVLSPISRPQGRIFGSSEPPPLVSPVSLCSL